MTKTIFCSWTSHLFSNSPTDFFLYASKQKLSLSSFIEFQNNILHILSAHDPYASRNAVYTIHFSAGIGSKHFEVRITTNEGMKHEIRFNTKKKHLAGIASGALSSLSHFSVNSACVVVCMCVSDCRYCLTFLLVDNILFEF